MTRASAPLAVGSVSLDAKRVVCLARLLVWFICAVLRAFDAAVFWAAVDPAAAFTVLRLVCACVRRPPDTEIVVFKSEVRFDLAVAARSLAITACVLIVVLLIAIASRFVLITFLALPMARLAAVAAFALPEINAAVRTLSC